ncbi:putative UDP-N-acetylmuramoylalanine/D-glutamate ligase [Streptomyces sp. Tu6071]|uniref:UDP-N-acetylmuramoyl-L-alanine--D-glutamate ligase n=1 Tax=Streptomyces sp. Tu6071 TaxID=355249 RepID=UPI00020E61C2|nr:UDP-N-acetylmuramoyl-L-alanine--D-glutamate ligase [Streptomyces sp. Tu6071]EGJ77900.1 putative UDP-N-acetylmuramoylalanine/D-glutamate ligase [Streptomyces sp. Tu6071]
MQIKHAHVLILGLGISGESAALLCAERGAHVTVHDQREAGTFTDARARLSAHPVDYQLGVTAPDPADYHLVVRSPGIPAHHPALSRAAEAQVPVWSEIELAHQLTPCPIVAVTGTNGKGTTTALIADMFHACGITAHRAGNMGIPLAPALSTAKPADVLVLEVSAAQLENVHAFAPSVAVITNIQPEHRNLYSWQTYHRIKAEILRRHTDASATVVSYDDPTARGLVTAVPGRLLYTSALGPLPASLDGVYVENGYVLAREDGRERALLTVADLSARGVLANVVSAAAAVILWGVGDRAIAEAARAYRGKEHVLEFVAERSGIAFYNDAKATNPYSTLHAVSAFEDRPLVLIAGGKDTKDADFTALAAPTMRRVRHLVLFGETAGAIHRALTDGGLDLPTTVTEDFTDATATARTLARPGDAVLFSPGTHTWDMTPDYLTRGVLFKQLVLS